MTAHNEVLEALSEENPEALLADGFEHALVGIARRAGEPALAVYSISRAINHLVIKGGLTHEGAEEYPEFNSIGAWNGPHSPIWLDDRYEEDR